jgi:chaperonin GroEL
VAGLMLTTDCMVAELVEDKPAGGGMGGGLGGLGGLGGMDLGI